MNQEWCEPLISKAYPQRQERSGRMLPKKPRKESCKAIPFYRIWLEKADGAGLDTSRTASHVSKTPLRQ